MPEDEDGLDCVAGKDEPPCFLRGKYKERKKGFHFQRETFFFFNF